MLSRRGFLAAGSATAASMTTVGLAADFFPSEGSGPRLYYGTPVENYRDYDGPLELLGPRGIKSPLQEEIDTADMILANAPRSTPFDVVRYFEDLTLVNREQEAYNAGWKDRWNPVIVAFFKQTDTTPEGDTTPWCAAFLNWCLARARYHGGTGSAASASFRVAPGETNDPSVGDIIVYKNTDGSCLGHAALVLARGDAAGQFQVLGGNQKNSSGHHSVNRKLVPFAGSGLTFHSFHRMKALKNSWPKRKFCPPY